MMFLRSWKTATVSGALFVVLSLASGQACSAATTVDDDADAKPLIGINLDVDTDAQKTRYIILSAYVDAVRRAGGIPVLIPPTREKELTRILSQLDGVMMIGGLDYPPTMYKQDNHKTVVEMSDERAQFDISLVRQVLKRDMPFLGICAGCQALNIGSGGSLIQDIPSHYPQSAIKHASPNGWQVGFNKHMVKAVPGSNLEKLVGKEGFNVTTSHHQCVDKVGDGLTVAAHTTDGVVESIESKDKPFVVGVQWHPERDFEVNEKLFREFIAQGRKVRQARLDGKDKNAALSERGCDFEPGKSVKPD